MNQIVFAKYDNRILEAYIENGTVMELSFLDEASTLNNIYIGKISNIVKNLNACFVDYGDSRPAYYSMTENKHLLLNRSGDGTLKIGDELLIQINKEAIKSKNPVATSELSLRGEYVVVNLSNKVGVSGKIPTGSRRETLKKLAGEYLPAGMGCIIRTNAESCTDEDLIQEIIYLSSKLSKILKTARSRTCFSCLYKNHPEYIDTFIVKYHHALTEIISDQADILDDFKAYFSEKQITDVPLTYYEDSLCSLTAHFNLKKVLENALKQRVWLKSGAYLVIEQTEAMVVIDVNTGKAITNKSNEQHLLSVNLEAAIEICRQLRLRNLSGIIVIDFINMQQPGAIEQVQEILQKELKKDSVPTKFVDITKLGLIELTRKKLKRSLKEQIGGSI